MNKSIITLNSSVQVLSKSPKHNKDAVIATGVVKSLTTIGAYVTINKDISERGEWFPFNSNESVIVRV